MGTCVARVAQITKKKKFENFMSHIFLEIFMIKIKNFKIFAHFGKNFKTLMVFMKTHMKKLLLCLSVFHYTVNTVISIGLVLLSEREPQDPH